MFKDKILRSIKKLNLDLSGCRVLTEAATGNYVVTPVIAAVAGADVTAISRDSVYGSISEVKQQTEILAGYFNLGKRLKIEKDISKIDLKAFDIVTNCGFVRPINSNFISKLSPGCVIPLMYEPWEVRDEDIDLKACREKQIKVYGTNEADPRLRTMEYIGYTVLYFLLTRKLSPFGANVLILGCPQFVRPVVDVLNRNNYECKPVTDYEDDIDFRGYEAIVVAEFADDRLIIGSSVDAIFNINKIPGDAFVIHIAGNVDFKDANFCYTPETPKPFRRMSYTTDFIDPQAVIDLHAAGLKVGEGMLKANRLGLCGDEYKMFMEDNYPALAIDNERYW